jgi:hypothetical protein
MNERKLTEKQIESLFDFCRKHYVPYYDLQIELVDHLASSIENNIALQPALTFNEALDNTYSEFGVMGFSKIRMTKEKGLLKKYKRMIWQYVTNYFRLPKIIITLAFTFFMFVLFHNTEKDSILSIIYIATVILFEIIYHLYIFPKYYKIKSIPGKKFLIDNAMKNIQGSLAVFPGILIQVLDFFRRGGYPTFNTWIELLTSFLMVVFTLFIIAFSFYVPGKIRDHFEEQFPQFAKS